MQAHRSTLHNAASTLIASGLSVIPVNTDKRPRGPWKLYQERPASLDDVARWFTTNGHPAAEAIAVLGGAVSGGLTVLDFDGDQDGLTIYESFDAAVMRQAPGLLAKLVHVVTQSGGRHLYLRCDVCSGNQVLALHRDGSVAIETRGEGGYVVAPPSPGYRAVQGSLRDIPVVTAAEYHLLLATARSLSVPSPDGGLRVEGVRPPNDGDRPGDRYNAAASVDEVVALLCRHGWQRVHSKPGKVVLTRPGKDARKGTSGDVAWREGMPIFTQFSSDAPPFQPQRGYRPFDVYALLEHAGDYSAAARSLAPAPTPREAREAGAPKAEPSATNAEPATFNWREHIVSLIDLMQMEFPEPRWFVEGIIPSGTTILAGGPKTGKSLLGWQIALAAAAGGRVLGKVALERRPILYICLEDHKRLVKKRTRRMLQGGAPPEGLDIADAWRPLLDGGIDDLTAYLAEHPGTDVIIDTYEQLRAPSTGGNAYREDYAGIKPLTTFAHEQDANVLIIHHTAKTERPDILMTVSGSLGLTGAVDNVMVATRHRFTQSVVTLAISGRDLDEDLQLALEYDAATLTHTLLGDADQVVQSAARRDVVEVLRAAGEALGLHEIADRLGKTVSVTLRSTLSRMVADGQIARTERGSYAIEAMGGPPEDVAVADVAMLHLLRQDDDTHARECAHAATSATSQQVQPATTPAPSGAPLNLTINWGDPAATSSPFPIGDAATSATSATGDAAGVPGCPGCGRKYTAVPAPYDSTMAVCSRCGCSLTDGHRGVQR